MAISMEICTAIPEVYKVQVDKAADLHGQKAVEVVVFLKDGRTVTGVFTTESKAGFGGVEFSNTKDVTALMTSKVNSVLRGTAE